MKGGKIIKKFSYILTILIFLSFLPFVISEYHVRLLTVGMLFGIAALGFNILYGYTGLLSFGHAMFWGLGAYGIAIATVKLKYGIGVGIVLSIVLLLMTAIITGYISLRHTRIYFAMLTLAFSQLIYAIILKWRDLTGADEGLYGIPRFVENLTEYYYLVLGISAIILVCLWWILESPLGLSFRAIRDNPYRAEVLGLPVRRVRLLSYIISGIITGIAGLLYAPLHRAITPEIIYWTFSAEIVFMAILGGSRSFIGPFIGGIIYIYLKDYAMSLTEYWMFLFGAILMIMVYVFPSGLLGLVSYIRGGILERFRK